VSFDGFLRVLSSSSLADGRDSEDLELATRVFRDAHCGSVDKDGAGSSRALTSMVFSEFMEAVAQIGAARVDHDEGMATAKRVRMAFDLVADCEVGFEKPSRESKQESKQESKSRRK
jgi:hypothetical protein